MGSHEWGVHPIRRRFMDPSTGRFTTLDSFAGDMQDPLSLNKYLYTQGDPINGYDPTGRHRTGDYYVVSFISDNDFEKSGIAAWWNDLGAGPGHYVDINCNNPDWTAAIATVNSWEHTSAYFFWHDEFVIAGHGGPGHLGAISLEELEKSTSGAYMFLQAIRAKARRGTAYQTDGEGHPVSILPTITFRGCNVAKGPDGKKFILLVAKQTGCVVYGYDDWYGPGPHGNCWCATPGGGLYVIKTYPPFKGSIGEFLGNKNAKQSLFSSASTAALDIFSSLPAGLPL